MGRHIINESSKLSLILKEWKYYYNKRGYREKQGSGYSFEKVTLNKSGNEKERGTSGSHYFKK